MNDDKIRLCYISSINTRWIHLEWMCEHLDRERFDISFLLLSLAEKPPHLEAFLRARGIPYERIDCKLTPGSILATLRKIYRYCRRQRPDIVHTHIFFASLVGLVAAFLARVPVRINTRHHGIMNHGSSFIWLDRLTNLLATRVVATSKLIESVLVDDEGVPPRKVSLVRLGIDLERFHDVPAEALEAVRRRYIPAGASPVIGVVARHVEWKGIQYIIPAFQRLLESHPDAFLVLAYAVGPYRRTLEQQLESIPSDRYRLIDFEEDVFALYKTFDLYVHTPVGPAEESFGLTYLEALAAGVPSIFTLSGVAPELLVHGRNAWVVEHKDSEAIHRALLRLLEDPALRETLVREGWRSVYPAFRAELMVRRLEQLYSSCVEGAGLSRNVPKYAQTS